MTPAQLARKAGVKPPSVSLWLNGTTKSIKGQNLLKAAVALQVTPDWLANGRGPKFVNEPVGAQAVQEERTYHGDASIAEAIKLLEAMSPSDRKEALSFLRVFGSKKGAGATRRQRVSIPAAARAA